MIKKNKLSVIIASLLTVAPIFAGLILWGKLPERMPTHWGINGEADGFSSKPFAVFALPLIMLALLWVCLFFTAKDVKNKNQNPKIQNAVIWIVPILSCVVSAVTYCTALGFNINVTSILFFALGVMAIVLGNYMPKCTPNRTIGVRVTWTLKSEENWYRTHRFAGIVWFFAGILLLICGFLPKSFAAIAALPILLVLAGAPILYSFILHKKGI